MPEKTKLTKEALEFFRTKGRKGGRQRAKKYSKRKLRQWANLGGRPKRTVKEQIADLRQDFQLLKEKREKKIEDAKVKFGRDQTLQHEAFKEKQRRFQEDFDTAMAERETEFSEKQKGRSTSQREYFQNRFNLGTEWRRSQFKKVQDQRVVRFEAKRLAILRAFERRQEKYAKAKAAQEHDEQALIANLERQDAAAAA